MALPPVPWWLVLLQGIAAVIIGLLLLSSPASTTLVIVQVLGWYWLFTGVLNLVTIFVDSTMWGWKLLMGLLGIVAGLAVIRLPVYAAILVPTTLVVMLGFIGVVMGFVDLVKAFKGGGVGIGLLGVLSILVGLVLLSRPVAGALVTPFVFGILGLAFGAIGVFTAFQMRKAQA